ncbi:MAG: ArsI/CadI family heavy metal resistance metalloenzyme [Bacteroidota bacterium]
MRLHLHLRVGDLNRSVAFYTALFGTEPTSQKADYAKWMLDEPNVNFSITPAGSQKPKVAHLGIEADTLPELQTLYERADSAEGTRRDEGETVCCYAKSTKGWLSDPQGIEWELFHTHGASDTFFAPEETGTPS